MAFSYPFHLPWWFIYSSECEEFHFFVASLGRNRGALKTVDNHRSHRQSVFQTVFWIFVNVAFRRIKLQLKRKAKQGCGESLNARFHFGISFFLSFLSPMWSERKNGTGTTINSCFIILPMEFHWIFSRRNLVDWWWSDWRVRRICSPLDCKNYQKNFFTRCFSLSFKAKHSELRSVEHRALLFSHCGFCCSLITQKTRRWWIVKKVLLLEIIKIIMDTKEGREKRLRHKSRSK